MYYRPRIQRRRKLGDYVMPFLIIICIGIIGVLFFNLWKAMFGEKASYDAYMHIESGSAQMKTLGTKGFFSLSSDTLVASEDEIKTSADAKVIVEFFDGTLMRISGGSDVIFTDVNQDKSDLSMDVMLVNGKVWFNKVYKNTGATKVSVTGSNIVVRSDAANVFEVENEFEEAVRVMHGDNVDIDVLSKEGDKTVDNEAVGVGQEMVFTDKAFEKYWQFQSPSLLAAISDDFKKTDWYLWNVKEDDSPTVFTKSAAFGDQQGEFVEVAPEVKGEESSVDVVPLEGVADEKVVDDKVSAEEVTTPVEEKPDLGPLVKPTISSVSGNTTVNENGFYVETSTLATLTGTVSGADKVVVNGYTLQKFKSGDKSWTYYANAGYNLMKEGENVYEVYALGPNGEKSEVLTVKVLYTPPAAAPESALAETPVPEETTPPADGDITDTEGSGGGDTGTSGDGGVPVD